MTAGRSAGRPNASRSRPPPPSDGPTATANRAKPVCATDRAALTAVRAVLRPAPSDGSSTRVQLALRVPDLQASIAFYSKLFGTQPAKLRDGYANFAIAEPPLKLVLVQGAPGEDTRMDHLGIEVESSEAVHAATTRLANQGLATDVENDTTCCYTLQDKVWVHGPVQEPWEVYVVKADAGTLTKQQGSTCCTSPAPVDTDGNEPVGASGCC